MKKHFKFNYEILMSISMMFLTLIKFLNILFLFKKDKI